MKVEAMRVLATAASNNVPFQQAVLQQEAGTVQWLLQARPALVPPPAACSTSPLCRCSPSLLAAPRCCISHRLTSPATHHRHAARAIATAFSISRVLQQRGRAQASLELRSTRQATVQRPKRMC